MMNMVGNQKAAILRQTAGRFGPEKESRSTATDGQHRPRAATARIGAAAILRCMRRMTRRPLTMMRWQCGARAYFDAAGAPVRDRNGVARFDVPMTPSAFLRTRGFSTSVTPRVAGPNGCGRIVQEFNRFNSNIDEKCLTPDGAPAGRLDGVSRVVIDRERPGSLKRSIFTCCASGRCDARLRPISRQRGGSCANPNSSTTQGGAPCAGYR